MDENRTDATATRKGGGLRLFLRLLLLLVVVLGLVFLAAGWDLGSFDGVRRLISYGGVSTDEAGLAVVYTYNRDSTNRFAQTEDGLAVVSQTKLTLLRSDGTAAYVADVALTEPAVIVGGSCTAAYDVGGQKLYFFNGEELVLEYTAEAGQSIVSARLNERGWLALVAGATGYKAMVTVYTPQGEAMFAFGSASRFVMDAVVTPDSASLVTAATNATDGRFVSELLFHDMTKKDPDAVCAVDESLVLAVDNQSGGLVAVGEDRLTMVGADGAEEGSYLFGSGSLRGWAISGSGFTALQLGRYKSGSAGDIVTVDDKAAVIATLPIHDEVLDLSAAGDYLAVLYADELVIYTKTLAEYEVYADTDYARSVLMRSDGSALLIGAAKAWLVLP